MLSLSAAVASRASLRAWRVALPAAPRRWLSAGSPPTILAALIERSPQITPDVPEHEAKQQAMSEKFEEMHKVYPTSLTSAEEGPDQQRARLRMESILERDATREGQGDRDGDVSSLDRRLAQRVYLLVRDGDGPWRFPQREWAGSPERARDGLQAAIEAACGESLAVHQMGNAPLAHSNSEAGSLFLWRFLYVSGDVDAADGLEHAWFTRDELTEKVDAQLGELAKLACGPYP